jgi:hypothetical protein
MPPPMIPHPATPTDLIVMLFLPDSGNPSAPRLVHYERIA